jgi:hypothetical protein
MAFNFLYYVVFTVSILLNFFIDYIEEDEVRPVRNLEKIVKHNLRTNFLVELLPLIPFNSLSLDGHERIF